MTFSPAARAAGSSPEARKKAAATLRKTVAARKAAAAKEGTLTTFNVSDLDLPKKKQPKAKKGARRTFTPAEQLAYVRRIETAVANGDSKQDAVKQAGIHGSQFYSWQRKKKKLEKLASKSGPAPSKRELRALATGKKLKLNGHAALNGSEIVSSRYDPVDQMMKVSVTINGELHLVTVDEAVKITAGLAAMGF